jgi:hypothetical protein
VLFILFSSTGTMVCAEGDARNIIAVMQATMMAVREREGVKD